MIHKIEIEEIENGEFCGWHIDSNERFLLSDNVIEHGSATSSIFRIDLKNNTVLTQSRRMEESIFGDDFEEVYKLIDENLVKMK